MRRTSRHLLNVFVTGLLAALPLAATILIFVWGARLVVAYVGPQSLVGGTLMRIGLGLTGSELVGYAIGVLAVALAVFALGLLVQTRLHVVLEALTDGVMQRIPLVRSVYDMVKKFVELFGQREDSKLRSMSPVWLHFGGGGGAAVLGLLSTPEPVRLGEIDYLAVLVPTAPVPVGGGLLYVPAGWVTPADVGMDGLTSIYVSMGITSSQHIGTKK
ncbi:DUF502 domain-containing protein [uncultured Piscinibacter sp.]|uniref:DUF502 domain-containing protein n=1 Tax=uncultured Piscinibacter sp. TaxID=1131835 RepID=UPI0026045BF0|nr:DUF502 domain-containing protein [uncultured Piscinibacter sp.]